MSSCFRNLSGSVDHNPGVIWPEGIVMFEHVVEICCLDFTTVSRARVRAFGLQDDSRHRRGLLGLGIRDLHVVVLGGPPGAILLTKHSQPLIPVRLAE